MALGIIGGSGLAEIAGLENSAEISTDTPYGKPSAGLLTGRLHGTEVVFLARHGRPHVIPPHCINYRANIWALRQAGVTGILAVNAVGGIADVLETGSIVIPDQVIDYTWGREHTYSDGSSMPLQHVDFTRPYTESMRQALLRAAEAAGLDVVHGGVYGATQGPRLESAAEVRRLADDGCDIVGMTGMPEAALARELGLDYACIALVVNMAAGISDELITVEGMETVMREGMGSILYLLGEYCRAGHK